jgi:predicted permease
LLLYTVGILLAAKSGGNTEKLSLKKCINPGVISVLIAIILFVTRLEVPTLIEKPISLLGSMTTPLSMLIIGVSLSEIKIREIFNNFRMYIFTIIKLVVIPLLVFLALSPFDLDPTLVGVTVVIAGMPVATNAVIVSTEYKGNVDLASKGVFLTTMFSVVTIPIIVFLLG